MTPEQKAREIIDSKLEQSGWIVQDMKQLNLFAGLGVAVREFPTSTGPVDYALFVEGVPVGIIEAKKDDVGENITAVEGQSNRYVITGCIILGIGMIRLRPAAVLYRR